MNGGSLVDICLPIKIQNGADEKEMECQAKPARQGKAKETYVFKIE